MVVPFDIPDEVLNLIAERAAALVEARDSAAAQPPYLTTEQAAEYLSCPASRIYDLRHRGVLPVYKDGSRNLFKREDLDAVLVRTTDSGPR